MLQLSSCIHENNGLRACTLTFVSSPSFSHSLIQYTWETKKRVGHIRKTCYTPIYDGTGCSTFYLCAMIRPGTFGFDSILPLCRSGRSKALSRLPFGIETGIETSQTGAGPHRRQEQVPGAWRTDFAVAESPRGRDTARRAGRRRAQRSRQDHSGRRGRSGGYSSVRR